MDNNREILLTNAILDIIENYVPDTSEYDCSYSNNETDLKNDILNLINSDKVKVTQGSIMIKYETIADQNMKELAAKYSGDKYNESIKIEKFAKAAGIKRQSYYKYRNNEALISREMALALGLAYHLNIAQMKEFLRDLNYTFGNQLIDKVVACLIDNYKDFYDDTFAYIFYYKDEEFPIIVDYLNNLFKNSSKNCFIGSKRVVGKEIEKCETCMIQ